MNMPMLSQMEENFGRLSLDEQLWLMERLVQRIKENTINQKSLYENDLKAMANDPQIQRELREIEQLTVLEETAGIWTEEKHPELKTEEDIDAWLQNLRK